MKEAKIGLADMLELQKQEGILQERKRIGMELMKKLDKLYEDIQKIMEDKE